ncbi:hypothetical protein [Mycobacterium sp. E740]|uniref:hypothetical protein n=1 Tax=Mycobacterium sp. E740 TaxID=1834149 RepID=UPI0007FD50D2|nr:hypothetical protein [Mycobacterium sp. E740]OBI84168.1 hypothetical protein A5663_12010 [Mycobacterium sp. E740]
MAEREAPGDFDYDEPTQAAGKPFDAFDADTWYFEPAPPPWYRTRTALTMLVAAAVAAVALVVSGVLLVFRAPDEPTVETATSVRPTAQSKAPTTRTESVRTEAPPPRAPVVTSAGPAVPPPSATQRPSPPSTRVSRGPQIGVTRTPVTRSPISVAPQRPGRAQP